MFSTTFLFKLLAVAHFALFVSGSPIAGDVPLPLQAKAPQNFVHPGVVIDRQQLDFVKSKIEGQEHPWYEAYQSLASNRFGNPNHPFHPRSVVDCGFYNKPDNGCRDEENDALTAYAMALLWYVSGQQQYADRSIAIMNGWANVITTHTNNNAPIQAGWAGASWSKAAEIIRYSNAGWQNDDIERFKKMLGEVYLPLVIKGSNNNGNWELGKLHLFLPFFSLQFFSFLLLSFFKYPKYLSHNIAQTLTKKNSDDGSRSRNLRLHRRSRLI